METIASKNFESNANLKKKRSEINWELEEEDNFKGNRVRFNFDPIIENNCAHMYEYDISKRVCRQKNPTNWQNFLNKNEKENSEILHEDFLIEQNIYKDDNFFGLEEIVKQNSNENIVENDFCGLENYNEFEGSFERKEDIVNTDDICGLEDICDLETDNICGLENYLA